MITIATFSTPVEAHLLRSRLESAGIPAFVQDENTIAVDWMLSNAIGGVRLQIYEEDLDIARAFFAAESPVLPDGIAATCPACQSTEIAPVAWPRRFFFLSILILQFPIFIRNRRWECASCGHKFQPLPSPLFSPGTPPPDVS